jgi:hypothetical protein
MRDTFLKNAGGSKVYFKITLGGEAKIMETGFRVDNNGDLKSVLRKALGEVITIVDD